MRASLFGTLGLLFAFTVQGALAAPAPKYQGDFKMNPQVGHTTPITGKMTAIQDNAVLTQVVMDLDKPVFGKSQFASKELWSPEPAQAANQLVLAFKLQGAPHKFYYVYVGATADGGLTYQGGIYRADAQLAEIQAAMTGPNGTVPATWKVEGDALVKAL